MIINYSNDNLFSILGVIVILLAVVFIYLLVKKRKKLHKNKFIEDEDKKFLELKKEENKIMNKLVKDRKKTESKIKRIKSLDKKISDKKKKKFVEKGETASQEFMTEK